MHEAARLPGWLALLTHLEQTLCDHLHAVEYAWFRQSALLCLMAPQTFHGLAQPHFGVVVVLHFKELLTQHKAILPAHVRAKNKGNNGTKIEMNMIGV